jgi:hypothetical protein
MGTTDDSPFLGLGNEAFEATELAAERQKTSQVVSRVIFHEIAW